MTVAREVWQSYDCPVQRCDVDLFGDEMVYRGQEILCAWCGDVHFAGTGANVEIFVRVGDETQYPAMPETAEDLQRLKDGA